uniref:Lap1_0 protein n=1 Tax=Fopius arisanus TaxID=64838 RepID=A0A0C9QCZ1_9HYME
MIMGQLSVHASYCLVLMTIVWSLSGVEGIRKERTLLNETESNEVPLNNEVINDERDSTPHPHSIQDKPSKLDLDVSEMIYMDSKKISEMETQVDSSVKRRSKCQNSISIDCLERKLSSLIDDMSARTTVNVTEAIQVVRTDVTTPVYENEGLLEKVHRYAKSHVMRINLDKDLMPTAESRMFFGAFGLKKLMIPLFIGVQIIKTMLVALFLPSIIGSIGKIVGKGLTSFAQGSGGAAQPEENFEFKDNSDLYRDDYMMKQPLGTLPASAMYDEGMLMQPSPKPDSRLSYVDSRYAGANGFNDRYYTRHVATNGLSKTQDFKVFHEIPTSSLLLTNYDPFYSPLLSRLDAVFSRLGYTTESCREYAVCAMYRSPARYAPYSNLVSAQLSRELNELRRPSTDNPDVLRFFKYMKAAKDGQDGIKCEKAYSGCDIARDDPSLRQNQAMLATYQDIDKLVHARKL